MTPDTRKQTDPKASGRQTSLSYSGLVTAVWSARNVVTLKKSVPSDWMTAAHHADRPGPGSDRRRAAVQVCSPPPTVKSTEPTKKVAASATGPTRLRYPGNGPIRKQAEPAANAHAMARSRVDTRTSSPTVTG